MKTYETAPDNVTYCKEAELTIKKKNSEFSKTQISSSKDAFEYIKQFYHEDIDIYESFFALFLNRKNQTIAYAKIAQGGLSMVLVDSRIIGKYALDTLAQSVIIAHNHPSGSLNPSQEDKMLTKRVQGVLDIIDVKLTDHIIITSENGYYSFMDNGGL